jgi:transcriptional regulator with XRE-family HTH domain
MRPRTRTQTALGTRLAALRRRIGLSQYKLAHYSQVSLGTIQGLEQGVREDPRLSTIVKLLKALKSSSTELIEKGRLVDDDVAPI